MSDYVVWVLDVEDVADFFLGSSSGCCSKADNSCFFAELLFDHLMQDQVSRSKVVRPLTRAMDFIDTYHGYLSSKLTEVLHEQSLWCYEENFDLFILNSFQNSLFGRKTLLRVKSCSRDEIRKFLKLICHQRDQGSNNKNKTGKKLGYKLVT